MDEKIFNNIPVALFTVFPFFGDAISSVFPDTVFDTDVTIGNIKEKLSLSDEKHNEFLSALGEANALYEAQTLKEVAEFGVDVDLKDARQQWSNTDEAVQEACVKRIEEQYAGETGNIIFYGPSNITMWYSLERDMLPYKAQNHGMGGCIDPEMIKYAPRLMYAFKPSVVFFQTGSNDLANGLTLDEILENKKKMYSLYLENMPDTKLVVMSGLPLPNRQQFWADTVKTNDLLKKMCDETDRMYFMDATDSMLSATGPENMATPTGDGRFFTPEYYRCDGIHLNKKGHDVWTGLMKAKLKELLA